MSNIILSFLSRDWAGLPLAVSMALVGGWLRLGRVPGTPWAVGLGYTLLAVAGLMALGSIRHLVHMARVRANHPPPGKLVDIGGYRLHVLAEGGAEGKPTIVWMPGGHAAGFAFYHLHRIFREETRSILVDRPGTGWSDIGPFPRTTAGEAVEVLAALDKSGEKGPFVLVGHSFGGLLVANMARRRPENVAGIVLLDATPPDTINYGPPLPGLTGMRLGPVRNILLRLFGIYVDLEKKELRRNPDPALKQLIDRINECLGEAGKELRAVEGGARSGCAIASIFAELTPRGLGRVGWETVVYDGDLGDLPVLLVSSHVDEFETVAKTIAEEAGPGYVLDKTRLRRFYPRTMERWLATSSRSQLIRASKGAGHNFPYQEPEFVAAVVRRLLPAVGSGPDSSPSVPASPVRSRASNS